MLYQTLKYIWVVVFLMTFSCTSHFEEANIDPTKLSSPTLPSLLTQGMLYTSGGEGEAWRGNFIYTTIFVQQFASLNWQGDKYLFDESYNSAIWDSYYSQALKQWTDISERSKADNAKINYSSVARIMKVLTFQRLTDLYGDIPYSEAGKGYISQIFAPKYDTQESIYNDLLSELDAAAKAFDASKDALLGDIIYNGNITLWKKAAYSTMLRVAMRLSKVNPTKAEEWAKKAVAGGVFEGYAEALKIPHLSVTYDNPNSHVLGYYNGTRTELMNQSFKFTPTFINLLKNNNDPRLKILSVLGYYTNAANEKVTVDKNVNDGSDDISLQKGLPNGLTINTIPDPINTYSQLRSDFTKADVPNIIVSQAQTLFLLAEAKARGWIATATSDETYFRQGIESAINQLKLYNPKETLFDAAAITNFVNTVAYPSAGTLDQKLEAINQQYYIASLLDGYESFANYRRSGYPTLTPVSGGYTGGTVPRRLQYPSSETGNNSTNLKEAITRQGANNWTTRIWWDKQ